MGETTYAMTVVKLTETPARPRSFWRDVLRYVLRDRLTMFALTLLLGLTLACLLGPLIVEAVYKVEPNRTRVTERYLPPGAAHPLGTDNLGRDQLIRLLYGGRISLAIAYSASVMSIAIGLTLGMIAGYYGGRLDDLVIWFTNTLNSIPTIFLLLFASTIWSPSAEVLIVLLAVLSWISTCRLVRGQVLSLRERDYVMAAHAAGTPHWWVMVYHILPNVLSIIITNLTISAGTLILIESGLSFLGLGVQPPTPTWGNMLTESRSYFANGAYLVFWPGTLITLTVLCFYVVGDGLRDALDPRSVRR
jgi:peptide/nickel transport system permease protein